MKRDVLAMIVAIVVLNLGLFALDVKASTTVTPPAYVTTVVQIQRPVITDANRELLGSLAAIENDLQNNNLKKVRAKYDEIQDYLIYYRSEAQIHKEQNVKLDDRYRGERVLEFKYGYWFNSKKLILPIAPRGKAFSAVSLKDKIVLSTYFKKNEINMASVEYVSFDTESESFRLDLHRLLAAIEESNISSIRESIRNIYDDMLVKHTENISLLPRIRDSLVIIRYLIDNNQFRAGEAVIEATDFLILQLIRETSNSPIERKKIKNLYKQLYDFEKVTDENYLMEWEKIPDGIENFWKNK